MSIQKRALWTALLLIVAVSAAGVAATWWQDRDITRLIDRHALQSMQSIQHFAEGSRQRELELKSAILASNPGFVGYVSQALSIGAEPGGIVDAASIRDLLEARRQQYNFDVAAVLDPRGKTVVMLGESLRTQQDFSSTPLMAKVRASSQPSIDLLSERGHLVLVSLSPMVRGDTIEAYLLTGVNIGSDFVAPLATAGHVDLALIGLGRAGNSVVASTLDGEDNALLLEAVEAEPALAPSAPDATEMQPNREFDLELQDGKTRASMTALFGATSSGLLVSVVPLEQRIVSTGAIRTPMLIAGAFVLIVLLLVTWLIQRRFVRPLSHLIDMSDRVLRGDVQVVARDIGASDISRIAAAFNQALAGLRGYKEAIEKREAGK